MMEQVIYIAVIAAAMVFGWLLSQRRQASRKGDEHTVAGRTPKPRPSRSHSARGPVVSDA